jgi:hypothetical protein
LKSIPQAEILIAKYLLIANDISPSSSTELCNNLTDDLFKASPRELPYLLRAVGLILHRIQVN